MTSYDIIIIGGGIAGLYTAYKILKASPHKSILILESSPRLGGRIHTFRKNNSTIWPSLEFGAGRFNSRHILLRQLIKELGLEKHIHPLNSNQFLPNGEPTPCPYLVAQVVNRARDVSREELQNQSFVDFARSSNALSVSEINVLKGYYGYYSELVHMNAYDAINLMKHGTNPNMNFYGMSGNNGDFTLIIEELAVRILESGGAKIMLKKNVTNVKEIGGGGGSGAAAAAKYEVYVKHRATPYTTSCCIFAVPRPSLERFSILREKIPNELAAVNCMPLCRIYSYWDNASWLNGLNKTVMDNDVRFVIPITSNVVMSSYTDAHFAEKWKRLYDRGGIAAINKKLGKFLPSSPKYSKIAYWKCGVGYWAVGADSRKVARRVIQPSDNLFICGENYSEKNQQWIEGSLETAETVANLVTRRR